MKKELRIADDLYREVIRKRAMENVGGCERCLNPKKSYKELQTSHYHGRARKSTRWNPDNSSGLCGGCHMYFTAHPLEHTRFFIERLGQEKFDLLEIQSHRPEKVDIEAVTLYLKSLLRELK